MDQFPYLEGVYFGNSLESYLITFGLFLGLLCLLLIINKVLFKHVRHLVQKTKNELDDALLDIAQKHIVPICYFASIFIVLNGLVLNEGIYFAVKAILVIGLVVQITRMAASGVLFVISTKFTSQSQSAAVTKSITSFVRALVWGIGFVFILDNLGFDVNAVIAGLGIGAIAIAFAAQAILGDLFNYFVIFFDRPFEEGDFVIVDDLMGVVEHIGIKTTRISSLGGEQLVFSNTDLTSSRIRNYKRMAKRRVVFKFGVVYQTSSEKLRTITKVVKTTIEKLENVTFDRAHFTAFGDSSLDFEVVYYVMGSDYNRYMDVQQEINLEIFDSFEKNGIDFAYPTQTLFLNKTTS